MNAYGKIDADRWAILIGINGYHESLGRLKYSVKDCRRLAEVLTTGEDAFPSDHLLVLADDEAAERKPTYANIHSWLASWLAQPDEDDTVVVFFAGHGRDMDGKCYLVPADATLQTIHVTGIPVPYIQELLNRCKARQKVLILDACHSGAGRDVATMATPMMETLSAGKGIYTLTSCDVDELSHEWDEKQQGVFSYYLAEALAGQCPPDTHGRITAEALYEWVYERVVQWARQRRCSQNPQRVASGVGSILLRNSRVEDREEHPIVATESHRERSTQCDKEKSKKQENHQKRPGSGCSKCDTWTDGSLFERDFLEWASYNPLIVFHLPRPSGKFCQFCGKELYTVCKSCEGTGDVKEARVRYCTQCGRKLSGYVRTTCFMCSGTGMIEDSLHEFGCPSKPKPR